MRILFAVLSGLTLALPADAASVAVVNPGFENIVGAQVTYNEFTFGSLPGWTAYDRDSVTNGGIGGTYYVGTLTPQILPARDPSAYQNFPAGAPEGQRVGIAFNFSHAEPGHEYGLQQTLAETLQSHTRYDLNVLVGNIRSGWSVDNSFFDLSGFPGYRIDLMAGEAVLASDDNTLAGTIPEGEWGQSNLSFTTGTVEPGQHLRIRLVNLNIVDPGFPGADREVDFDRVVLTATAVPEPETTALLTSLGAVALIAARLAGRRRPARA